MVEKWLLGISRLGSGFKLSPGGLCGLGQASAHRPEPQFPPGAMDGRLSSQGVVRLAVTHLPWHLPYRN